MVLAVIGTVGAALVIGADFWEDGGLPPIQVEGSVRSINRNPPSTIPGSFKLVTSAGETYDFTNIKNNLLRRLEFELQKSNIDRSKVIVTFSPHLRNVYTIQVADSNNLIIQDVYEPGQNFQPWQRFQVYIMGGLILIGLLALVYVIMALFDWFWPLQRMQGVLVARIERAEARSEGFSIVVRPWDQLRPGRQTQFELGQPDFLTTDGVDYIEVFYTRVFRFVRQVRPISIEELPSEARSALRGLSAEGLRLSYAPGWRLRAFLYSDGLLALFLFGVTGFILLSFLPDWNNPQAIEPPQRLLLPMIAMFSSIGAVYLLFRFSRKLQDVKAPKRVTVGPVLSKWRVTGTSNDNRRLIVVADGGLAAGEQSVRKFDLSPALFDQLQVGDIVEIEHTPRLRFICRLEVKGHQELTRSYQI